MTPFSMCLLLGIVCLSFAGICLSQQAKKRILNFPRNRLAGMILTACAWIWVGIELYRHPVDLLAFFSPTTTLCLALVCIPLSWVLLENLLSIRALGGLLMLWPMPVILAIREHDSLWRLIPITLGYIHLILGMIFVFYPWTGRVICEWLAERKPRLQMAVLHTVLGIMIFFAAIVLSI